MFSVEDHMCSGSSNVYHNKYYSISDILWKLSHLSIIYHNSESNLLLTNSNIINLS